MEQFKELNHEGPQVCLSTCRSFGWYTIGDALIYKGPK